MTNPGFPDAGPTSSWSVEAIDQLAGGIEIAVSQDGIFLLSYSFGSIEEANKFLASIREQFPSFSTRNVRVTVES